MTKKLSRLLLFMLLSLSGIYLRSALANSLSGEPPDYRTAQYRAPVPETLKGARVISTAEAKAIWNTREAIFIDVLPRLPKPDGLPEGTIWRDTPRFDIPGSKWLPNVGYGRLHLTVDTYFRTQLIKQTGGKRDQALVFYCLEDCWMSWNAAKRAMEYGYTRVIWYPEGTDGWGLNHLPLELRLPE